MFPALYHAHHNRHLEDLPFWLELADQADGLVLELGCGTGRVLLPLARAGYPMVGVDHDLSMLKYLQSNTEMRARFNPMLLVAEISHFNLAAQFSLIILPCNTFSSLVENDRRLALACIHRHLQPGGIFATSLPNPARLKAVKSRSIAEIDDEFSHPDTHNPVQVSSTWQRTKYTLSVTWIYDHLLPDGTIERLTTQTIQQIIPPEKYIDEIHNSGLQLRALYGDFDNADYSPDSPELIILAARPRY
jgi:SAM-dependent methyltransferase